MAMLHVLLPLDPELKNCRLKPKQKERLPTLSCRFFFLLQEDYNINPQYQTALNYCSNFCLAKNTIMLQYEYSNFWAHWYTVCIVPLSN